MSSPLAIGFDFGATTIKPGVVREGVIIEKAPAIITRQDGDTDASIREMLETVARLRAR
jgi:predicted NBD/HSP70 family sugar kinase